MPTSSRPRPRASVVWRRLGLAVAATAACACTARAPRVDVEALRGGLDAFLASHQRTAGQEIRADEVARTATASYHVVQVCGAEQPHRHLAHDLTSYVLRGRGVLTRDGERIPMRAGDAAVVARGTPHAFARDGGACAVTFVAFTPPLDAPDTEPVDSRRGGR